MTVNTREKPWVLEREREGEMLLFLTILAEMSTVPAMLLSFALH